MERGTGPLWNLYWRRLNSGLVFSQKCHRALYLMAILRRRNLIALFFRSEKCLADVGLGSLLSNSLSRRNRGRSAKSFCVTPLYPLNYGNNDLERINGLNGDGQDTLAVRGDFSRGELCARLSAACLRVSLRGHFHVNPYGCRD